MLALRKYGAYLCLAALVVISLIVWTQLLSAPRPGELKVAIMDIGQGDGIYIQSPTGVEVLIDAGPDSSVLRELPKQMAYGDHTIDAIIVTHPDADHEGGFVDLLQRYTVKNFISSGIVKHTITNDKLENEVDDEKIRRIQARRGQWLDLGGGARLDILFPDFDASTLAPAQDHEGCVIARLVYKSASAIFTCDAARDVEDHLISISSSTELKSDVLKVGHHGSRYSSSNEFLDAVAPTYAAISVGAHNRYGHPTEETLGRLVAHHIPISRTDQEGAIVFVSDGGPFVHRK